MIELVVFDMAGTTVYDGNAVNDSFRAALSGVGVAADPVAVNAVMGFHKPVAIRRLLTEAGRKFTDADVDAIHTDFVKRMKHYYATDPSVREIPGAGAVFTQLRRNGIKIALNSGFSREIIDAILDRLGWTNAIDISVASNEVPKGRPDPAMIRLMMNKLGIHDASKVAKVGDTPVDLEEGYAAGCSLVIGVTTGAFTRSQLETCRHTHLLDSVVDVPALLNGEAPG